MGNLAAVDIDGTISANADFMRQLMLGLKSQGWSIAIVSGNNPTSPSGATWADKAAYLQSVDVTDCWDELIVASGDIPATKAKWCKDNHVDVMIDNDKRNAQAALDIGVPLVLVPWATREPTKKGK